MWKTIAKVFMVFVFVAAMVGAFDVAVTPGTATTVDGVSEGFSLGILPSVAAGCPDDDGSTKGCGGGG